jgi:ureidoglycolate hydrolase
MMVTMLNQWHQLMVKWQQLQQLMVMDRQALAQ